MYLYEAKATIFYSTLFCVLFAIHWQLSDYAFDDAYIHFRIAENYLTYGEPYFNRGEQVMVTSSPLYTLVLTAIFGSVGVGLVGPVLFNSFILTLCCGIFSKLAEDLLESKALWLSGVVSLLVIAVLFNSSVGLMETPLALLLIGVGTLLYLRGKTASMLFFGLAVFVRLESIVALGLIVLFTVINGQAKARSFFLYTSLGILPLLLWTYLAFGTILPNTVLAKSKLYELEMRDSFIQTLHYFHGPWISAGYPIVLMFFLLALGIIYIYMRWGRRLRWKNELIVLGLMLHGLLILFAYVSQGTFIFPWYTPLYTLPLLFGISILSIKGNIIGHLLLLILCFPLVQLTALNTYAAFFDRSLYSKFEEGARVRKYLEVGESLYKRYPDATLMTSEIGGLGFGFKGYIYDGGGLASPEAKSFHPLKVPEQRSAGGLGAIPLLFIKKIKPDIIVSLPRLLEENSEEELSESYNKKTKSIFIEQDILLAPDISIWGNHSLEVYVRRRDK